MTYQQIASKTTKTSFNNISSAFVLVDIKADLRNNSPAIARKSNADSR
ncbi:MAG: hypothetical protein IBX57_03835 [Gammaproteobacteria bacterium]|nr:hypothetical protein [Gammaproteobacteria bacterium]